MNAKILDYDRVIRVTIPKKWMRKLFNDHEFLTEKDKIRLQRFCARIDAAQLKLSHARSIGEQILLRS